VLAGKYRVESMIGQGGMGYVFTAQHLELRHHVALKVLRQSALDSPEAVERFLREARAAARLQSEHVAKVSDVGRLDSGAPFMVMELLEGEDLSRVLEERAPLLIEEAVDYIVQACEALADAHRHGIVHRDLKPANIFVTSKLDGTPFVKVLDFGISKTKLGDAITDITSTDAIMGSPKYMSPEQMQDSRNVDPRSDVWSLGAILYESLTGHTAFDAPTIATLCVKILKDEVPSPRSHRPDLPPELEVVVLRCLEKDPQKRTPSVADLASELEPFASADTRSLIARIARGYRAPVSKRGETPPSNPSDGTLDASSSSVGGKVRRAARAASRDGSSTMSRRVGTYARPTVVAVLVAGLGVAAFVMLRSPARSASPAASASPAQVEALPPQPLPRIPPAALVTAGAEPVAPSPPSAAPAASGDGPPHAAHVASAVPARFAPSRPPPNIATSVSAVAPAAPASAAPRPTSPPSPTGGVNDSVLEDRR
jgi:serine/threonine-protein kinase